MTSASAWFIGEGSLLIQAVEIWLAAGQRVDGIAAREPNVAAWAAERGIKNVDPGRVLADARQEPFDFLFSVVNLVMLPAELIKLPRKLAINFHDGPLPRYAGVNVPVWAILNNQPEHGVTWHEMQLEADTGDMLVQQRFPIAPDETAFSLNAKCFTAGIETFRELTQRITTGALEPVVQDLSLRSYFGFYQRPGAAQVLAFDEPADVSERLVRALDFGTYPNPVGLPKLALESGPLLVGSARALEAQSSAAPGTVVAVEGDRVRVATATQDLELGSFRELSGAAVSPGRLSELGVRAGARLPVLDAAARSQLGVAAEESAKSEGFFVKRLSEPQLLDIALDRPDAPDATAGGRHVLEVAAPGHVRAESLAAWALAFFARVSGSYEFDVSYADPALRERAAGTWQLFASEVPLRVKLAPDATVADAAASIEGERKKLAARFPYPRDLLVRQPRARSAALPLALLVDVDALPGMSDDAALRLHIDTSNRKITLHACPARVSRAFCERLARRLAVFTANAAPEATLRSVALIDEAELSRLADYNRTARDVPDTCLHTAFEAQVARTPDKIALTSRGKSVTYRELDQRANALAHALAARGVKPDTLVGVYLERSIELMVATLGILKAGGAYVPLDPEYPADRIRFMIADAKLPLIVTDRASAPGLGSDGFEQVVVDGGEFDAGRADAPASGVAPHNLAYVIYTSGSTGKPKGVMLEHRNVSNFIAGMDEIFGPGEPGVWLAVTSLSFDISVLELFAPLTRGYQVVIASSDSGGGARPITMSLFYFSANSRGGGPEHYRLLMEGARFADENGFVAVWTPERHFHEFGGLYPNPSVASAALAMITKKVALRAGSCVSPLHTPIRIAEEWSFVDNISNGRVGISFASGWQPNDFSLRPQNFEKRRDIMYDDIDIVRRLWRGEAVEFPNGVGKPTKISTLPRPVQRDLPVWVTAAGNPETFEAAGRAGCNLLTHLLGQTTAEVEEKVKVYRAAWKKAGHPGEGTVTLMLHTFLGENDEQVKNAVREPMKEYLKSAVGLIKEAAWSFPTFKQKSTLADGSFSTDQLTPEEFDAVMEHAFLRYYETSGLFGSEENAQKTVEAVRAIGVDEIACLIDFGVPTEQVLAHLPYLANVLRKVSTAPGRAKRETLGELFAQHKVTHLQCTPSMASMLVSEDETREALKGLSAMLVGGEALPPPLATQLKSLLGGPLFNMYGPTETTIWSSYQRVDTVGEDIPIGRPIANTDILILDRSGGLVPPGEPGELAIGGKGVARGYLGREELTAERFISHPLRSGERLYRTGDLALFDEGGVLRFKGRLDHQVKVRGYRIELGEIEARLGEHPHVRECAVIVREDVPGDKRLVAYFVPSKQAPSAEDLRRHLNERVPDYMVPAAFVQMAALPQTPNKKIDRKALPRPDAQVAKPVASGPKEAPSNVIEETIGSIWREVLGLSEVSVTDNFFDLGGHSLLTIQVLGKLKPRLERPVSLVDLFRYPTIRSLAAFLGSAEVKNESLDESAARGAERQRLRRAMVDRRRG